ncbi:MAG TPA: nucleotidyltransferase family protein, partial [Longimicrobiales bacterium]|nr:nucleotidyltransferase family protein [Longimicrobiales bacterium]
MEVHPPDARLLTRCLRRGRDEDLGAELSGLDGQAWSRLVDRAVWHGVAPLLHHRLGRWEDPGIPPSQRVRLRDVYHHCFLRNRAILEQLSDVLREITGAGHPVLALKGAHLAYCVYDEPALRPLGDIDLLARPDDAPNVQRHLETLGYRHAAGTEGIDYSKLHHLRPVSRPGLVDVEVHHDLAPRGAPFTHDLLGLWDRSIHTPVADFDLPHLAPDDVLLHVCAHA